MRIVNEEKKLREFWTVLEGQVFRDTDNNRIYMRTTPMMTHNAVTLDTGAVALFKENIFVQILNATLVIKD